MNKTVNPQSDYRMKNTDIHSSYILIKRSGGSSSNHKAIARLTGTDLSEQSDEYPKG